MAALGLSSNIHLSEDQFEIITAAGKILTQSGLSGLSITALAGELGCAESAVTHHFQTLEDVIMAMFDYLAFDMETRYTHIIEEPRAIDDKFARLFRNQAAFFTQNPFFAIVVFSDGPMNASVRIKDRQSHLMATKLDHLTSIIASGQQSGTFRQDIPTEDLAHIVMGAFRLLMYKWRISNFGFDLKQRNKHTIESMLKLLKT